MLKDQRYDIMDLNPGKRHTCIQILVLPVLLESHGLFKPLLWVSAFTILKREMAMCDMQKALDLVRYSEWTQQETKMK